MAERFLNKKTKKVFLGSNTIFKLKHILDEIIPYQKVMFVVKKRFLKENKNYFDNLLKACNRACCEYIFEEDECNKNSITKLLEEINEDVACVVALGDNSLISSVKVVSFISKIPYVIMPTVSVYPDFLLNIAKVNNSGINKVYKVNFPLAVLVDKDVILKQNNTGHINSYCQIVSLCFGVLDSKLTRICHSNTAQSEHYKKLNLLVEKTINLNENLYNYNTKALLELNKNAINIGIILTKFGYNLLSSDYQMAKAFRLTGDSKLGICYYKVISGMFLLNVFESFINNIKNNNYMSVNLNKRLQILSGVMSVKQINNNLLDTLEEALKKSFNAYHIKEYKVEMLEEIKTTKTTLEKAYKVLKRMNLGLSFYAINNLDTEVVKKAICLAPDLCNSNNFLKIIRNFGVLDYNF
jgi:hypothetical protein